MRRGPAIGGHLPRVSEAELGQMTPAEWWAYHSMRQDVFAARAGFFSKLALVSAVLAAVLLLVSVVLWLA